MTKQRVLYSNYTELRAHGKKAQETYRELTRTNLSVEGLISTMISIVVGVSLFGMIKDVVGDAMNKTLWITSPSGKLTLNFPLWQALRIVKKHNWKFAEVEPIRRISRKEALTILFKGDTQ